MRGYIQVRIMHNKRYYHKHFGKDSPLARELAQIHLAEKRKEILMGRFGVTQELPVKRFAEAARLYFSLWSKEMDAEGKIKHRSARETGRVIEKNLIPNFGKLFFNDIKPLDVVRWREKRLISVIGTSVNREQAILSSIFSHIERWVKTEEIPAFKLPRDQESGVAMNPCTSVERAPNRKRTRILSILELTALKRACFALDDPDMWEICGMALQSVLRKKDLEKLEAGESINTIQAKTQHPILLPIGVTRPLNFSNFKRRWMSVRKAARLEVRLPNGRLDVGKTVQTRDIRKSGLNMLKEKGYSMKLLSEFAGHAEEKTTEIYMVKNADHLKPMVKDLKDILEAL